MARKTFVEEMEDKYNLAPTTGAEEVQTDTTTSDSTGRRGFEDQFKGYDLGAVEQKYGLTPIAVPENSLAAQSQQAYSDWKIKAQQGHDEWMKRLERGDFINKDNRKQSETASPEAKTQQEEDPSFKRQAREWIADTVDKAFGEGASDGRWYGADSNPILGFITDRWARQKEPDYEPDVIDKAGDWFYGDNSIPGIIADTVVGKDRAPEPRRAPEVKQAPSYGTDDYLSEQQALLNANKPKETAPVAEPETPAPAPTEAPSLDELRSEWYELRAKETMGQASDEEIARARELEQEIQNHDDLTDWFSKPPINDWEGRQELIDELNNLPFTAEGKARQAEIVTALREGDEKAGNPAMPYTGMERLESAVNATGHGIEASAVNTAGTAAALANQNSSEYESTNPNNSRVTGVNAATGRTYSENDAVAAALDEQAALRAAEESRRRREAGERYNAEHTGLAETSDKLWETADALDEKSQQELAEAKAGLSKLGQAGVDLGENLLEMGFDAVVGSATGVGGLASMGARLFGSATQEARQEGVDLTSQLTYGALETAKEIFTEKMFDGLAGIYGAGAADEIIEKFVGRMADTDLGRTLLRGVIGSGGEGLEEVASAYLDPLAKQFISNDSVGELYRQIDGDEVMYEFFMGAAAGLFGNAGTIVTGQDAAKNAELRAEENAPQYNPIEETVSAAPQFTQATAPEATTQAETTPFEVAPALSNTPTETRADDTTAVESAPERGTETESPLAWPRGNESGSVFSMNSGETISRPDDTRELPYAPKSGTVDQASEAEPIHTESGVIEALSNEDRMALDDLAKEQGGLTAEIAEALGLDMTDEEIEAYNETLSEEPTATESTGGGETSTEAMEAQESTGGSTVEESPVQANPIADTVEESTRPLPGTEQTSPSVQETILGEETSTAPTQEAATQTQETTASQATEIEPATEVNTTPIAPNRQQALNIYVSNIKNAATKAGIDLKPFFDATSEMNAFNLSRDDVDTIVTSLSPVVDQLEANGDTNARKYLDSIARESAHYQVTPVNTTVAPTGTEHSIMEEIRSIRRNGSTEVAPTSNAVTASDGAAPPANPNRPAIGDGKTGKKRSKTESHTEQEVSRKLGAEQEELYYTPITERQTLTEAVNRVAADFVGEMNNLLDKGMWTASDVDTGLTIYGKLQADSVITGDHTAAQAWARVVQEHGTGTAQALQAFKKWTRTAKAMSQRAIELLDSKDCPLLPEQKRKVTSDIENFADELDRISNMDREDDPLPDIRNLILQMAKYRNTETFVKSNYEKLLMREDDFDYLMEYAQRQIFAIADDYSHVIDIGQWLKTWQVNAQLSRLGTFFRNIGGNLTFGALDTMVQDGLGVAIDHLLSKYTGHREVKFEKGWFSSAARRGAAESFRRSVLEVAGDINMSGNLTRYGTSTNRTAKMSSYNRLERMMSRWEQLLAYSLSTSDAVFRGKLEGSTFESIARGEGLGLEDINRIASERADYRLFQNKGAAYRASKDIHDWFNRVGVGGTVNGSRREGGFGLGDFINPYPGVPANLAVKALEYSPANIIKGARQLSDVLRMAKWGELPAGAQSEAVMNIARGMSGIPILALLTAMFKTGLIKNADDEEDLDAKAQMKAEGRTGVQINISALDRALAGGSVKWKDGDDLLSVGWMEPLNAFLAIASMMSDDLENGDSSGLVLDYLDGAIQGVLDMPVMGNIANIYDTLKYSTAESGVEKAGEAAVQAAGDMLTGMIPAPISQLAKTSDQYFRDTSGDNVFESVWNSALNSIPGARQTLPIKQDNFGNPKESTDDFMDRFLNNFIRPGAVYEMHQSAVSAETEKVYREAEDAGVYPDRNGPKKVSIGGEKYTLTQDERQKYHETAGREIERLYSDLINSDIYDTMTAEEKAETMRDLKGLANDNAKREYAKDHGLEYSSNYDKTAELYDPGAYFAVRNQATTALENGNYDVIDALLGKDGYYSDLSRKAKDRMDTGDTANLDKMYEARQAGISSEQWQQAYDYKKSLEEKPGVTQTQRDNYFKKWLGDNFTSKQADVLHDQMQFRTSSVASSTVYDGLSDKLGSETAVRMYDDMKPYSGQDAKQWEKIQGMAYLSGYTEAEKWAGLSEYVSDSCYKKAMEAKAAGQSFKEWADEYVRKNRK